MKILVDISYIVDEKATGLSAYAFRLLEGFRRIGCEESVVLLAEKKHFRNLGESVRGFKTVTIDSSSIPYLPFTRSWMTRKKLNAAIEEHGISVFLSTYLYDRSLFTDRVPSIGVIHDTHQFVAAENRLLLWRFLIGARKAVNSFTRIVAISEATRSAIEKLGWIRPPVSVVPNSIEFHGKDVLEKNGGHIPYILDVNTMIELKNAITLLRAFDLIKDRVPHKLIFKAAHTSYWDCVMQPFIESHSLAERVKLIDSHLDAEALNRLYADADLFVSPSTMEGFGSTPIEATAAGCPVICNALPAMLESTKGLLDYYSPADDAGALAEKMLHLLSNPDRDRVKRAAEIYREEYSVEKNAGRILDIARKISGANS